MAVNLDYLGQYASTTMNKAGGLNNSDTAGIVLTSIPSTVDETKPGSICFSYADPLDTDVCEWISYTSINAGTKELQGAARADQGYSAKAHNDGCTVAWTVNRNHVNELNDVVSGTTATHKFVITTADEDNNTSLAVTQSDVTNNPICTQLENDGTNHGVYIKQDGVLASNKAALYVESDAAQVNGPLTSVVMENASSTNTASYWRNDGTGHCVNLNQTGVLAAGKNVLYIYSNVAQVNAPLVKVVQDHASSDQQVLQLANDGTGQALYIDHNGTSGTAFDLDSTVGNDGYLMQAHADAGGVNANAVWAVRRNDDLQYDICMRIGGYWLWADGTGDLRIGGYPTSDTDGTVVGTQT